jgi:hypothetical protein
MATPSLDAGLKRKIYQMGQETPRLLNRDIASKLQVSIGTVNNYRDVRPKDYGSEDISTALKTILRKTPKTVQELAKDLHCKVADVRAAISQGKAKGVIFVELPGSMYALGGAESLEKKHWTLNGDAKDRYAHRFGFITDNHLCNKHSRIDVLNAAYDRYEAEGITTVFNGGNWIDGEARFNKNELVVRPGMQAQIDYMVQEYPQRKGIRTCYVAGDDHEGWYQQREGIEIGKHLQNEARDAGREDLAYLGYGEADVSLKMKHGESTLRLVHAGGGSAYALSYTVQKLVESYQGGEKPQILLVGHYHKFDYCYPREVHTIQGGCTTDQSLFLRKNKIQVMVGYCIVNVRQDEDGIIRGVEIEWSPYYDRKFYENRY